jgi:small GTP-binding protein
MDSKIILVGDSNVGKTTFIEKLITGDITNKNKPTIGATIKTHIIDNIEYIIWDTSGWHSFRTMIPLYYNKSNCVFIFYDMTKDKKYETIKEWIDTILASHNKDIPVVMVGTRSKNNNAVELDYNNEKIKTLLNKINLMSTITLDIMNETHEELIEKFNLMTYNVAVDKKSKITLQQSTIQSDDIYCCCIS